MPELPEVEHFRKYIDRTSLRQKILSVKLTAPVWLLKTSARLLKETLEGNQFEETHRHGKFLFIKMKRDGFLMLHFGMTGDLHYTQTDKNSPKSFALKISFKNGHQLFFTDPRRFGRIAIVKEVEQFVSERGYGTDALEITKEAFLENVRQKKTAIKTVLINQKNLAGVGNEFADEILFQSRIHPESLPNKLSDQRLSVVFHQMKKILAEAVSVDADRKSLTHYFFLDNRAAGLRCPNCEGKTELKTIGGRSTYYCPSCQVLYR